MRQRLRTVPEQLGSAALRYRQQLAPASTTFRLMSVGGGACDPAEHPIEEHSQVGRDARLQRLESILFLAREPLSSRKLAQFASLADATEARTLARRLNELYDNGGRAFRVEEVAGGYQLLTRPRFADWLRRLDHVPGELRLSGPALETLAVVAYRQPTGRAEVEAIRGVSCGEILRQLMDRDLVRIQGRSEELGRPYLYATTRRFLQLFGLKSLDKLPRVAEMQNIINQGHHESRNDNQEECDVTATTVSESPSDERWQEHIGNSAEASPRAESEEGDEAERFDEDFDDDDDDEDDFDDDDDDDEEADDDYDGDEWQEVGDEDDDDDDDDDDDEDDDWDDDDDAAWGDDDDDAGWDDDDDD